MNKGKKLTRKRRGRKRYTRKRPKYQRAIPLYVGGRFKFNTTEEGFIDGSGNTVLLEMKNIIDTYLTMEDAKTPDEQSSEYVYNIKKFQEYKTTLKGKKEKFTTSDSEILTTLISIIVKNNKSFIYYIIKKIQGLLASIYLYFANDIEINDNTKLILRKRETNNTPYSSVIHTRNGYETTYDVNEMLHLIKMELDDKKYKETINKNLLKKINIDTAFTLEPSN
jgi:hypothetical protein